MIYMERYGLIEEDYHFIARIRTMSGSGLSKILDYDYNHFLFVSCTNCAYVEMYNPDILRGHKSGKLGTVMDILFG